MNTFIEKKIEDFSSNAFTMIGKEWMLISAEKDGKVNTMTASWGGLGILWNEPVAYIFIRPQRYTKEFVDANEKLTLSVLDDSFRKQLSYLGTVSGRDENKIEKAGLTVRNDYDAPFFDEAKTVFVCKKLFAQELNPDCFIEKAIDGAMYPNHDYHTMYVCRIEKILER